MSPEKKEKKVRVGITSGDINGIGMEVIIKTFMDNRMLDFCTPVVYGSSKVASIHRKALEINEFKFNQVKSTDSLHPKKPNIYNCWDGEVEVELGESTELAGKFAFQSLQSATQDLASNKIDVMVTAPFNKSTMASVDFPFPGHTEYLADYANEENPLMIMVHDNLRVGVATGHIPLKDVSAHLNIDMIVTQLKVFAKSLIQDFSISRPRLAVLGLNPHAGDEGVLGEEENKIIGPAIRRAREEGLLAFGPYSADGFFGSPAYRQFDGILAMYHDQGLIPFKTISFDSGVNYTAGLPIVRTSPDHGTAYDIAGKNQASEQSFRNAVFLACSIYKNRKAYRQLSANPLTPPNGGNGQGSKQL